MREKTNTCAGLRIAVPHQTSCAEKTAVPKNCKALHSQYIKHRLFTKNTNTTDTKMKAVYSVQVKYDMLVHHTQNLHQPCGRNNIKVISILRELRLLSLVYRSLRILFEYMMIPLGHPNLISPFFGSLRTSECHRDVKTPSARSRLLLHTAFTAPHAHTTHAHKLYTQQRPHFHGRRTRIQRLHTYTHFFFVF